MATLEYSEIVEVSEDDSAQALLTDLSNLGFTATSWGAFSQAGLHVHLGAQFRSDNSKIAVYLRDAFLLATATGETLTKLASSNYQIDRNLASPAQIRVIITCSATAGPYTINVDELTFTHTPTGQTYRNVADASGTAYPATLGSGASLNMLIEAEVSGAAANIATPLTLESIKLVLDSSHVGVAVTSQSLEVSGVDEESDDRLRTRCQLQLARNQPRLSSIYDGVVASALDAAPGVVNVSVDDSNPRGPATFDVYIAGLDTTASGEDKNNVQLALDYQTFGRNNTPKTVNVVRATEFPIDIAGTVYYQGATLAAVQAAVTDALVAFVRATLPGGWSYSPNLMNTVAKNDIESVIRSAVQSVAAPKATVVLTTPVVDVAVPKFGKVVRGNWDGLSYVLISS